MLSGGYKVLIGYSTQVHNSDNIPLMVASGEKNKGVGKDCGPG
jgi:hypothetical protein